ncbi:hypothetical protein VE02_00122 [Pseudogymnoascus sp. 03VT05]|nr:hypothetical protein VE02_00122 [Pseudogymnoascus sp. 03VT05]
MRFSAATLLALPLLAVAETQDPLQQLQDTALHYFNKAYSLIPHTNTFSAAEAAIAKAGGSNVDVLSLDNWRSTLLNSVTPASKGPEEWWVLLTAGNKTCWGNCEKLTRAFNESALLFKADPTAPHLGLINCDHQPILCHSWTAGAPLMYIFEVNAPPAKTDVHVHGFNTTTVTAMDLVKLHATKSWKERPAYEGHFHPFHGTAQQYGLDLATGWVIWAFNILPNWAFMILISFASRSMMSRREQGRAGPAPAAAPAR